MGNRANKAKVECILGATGSGKTSYVMQELKRLKPKRLMIWDTKGEFAEEGYAAAAATMGEVVKIVASAGKSGAFKLAYKPKGDERQMKAQFNIFCKLAFAAKKMTVVAEELADVTTANYAVEGWRKLSSQGRTEGITLYGLSQQPASIDKHFFGNASLVWSGRLNFASHIKTVSNVLRVKGDEITELLPLDWIARDMNTGIISRGNLAQK